MNKIEFHIREILSYWDFRIRGKTDKEKKSQGESGAIDQVLTAAGLMVECLRPKAKDVDENAPPDCEAYVDGRWSGIEHTELVHQQTLERSLKAVKRGKANEAAYFVWTASELIGRLQERITEKDLKCASAYERYVLVIVTDEPFLDRRTAMAFLTGATFKASWITDAFLGLSYDPAIGDISVHRLVLEFPAAECPA